MPCNPRTPAPPRIPLPASPTELISPHGTRACVTTYTHVVRPYGTFAAGSRRGAVQFPPQRTLLGLSHGWAKRGEREGLTSIQAPRSKHTKLHRTVTLTPPIRYKLRSSRRRRKHSSNLLTILTAIQSNLFLFCSLSRPTLEQNAPWSAAVGLCYDSHQSIERKNPHRLSPAFPVQNPWSLGRELTRHLNTPTVGPAPIHAPTSSPRSPVQDTECLTQRLTLTNIFIIRIKR